MIEIWLNGNRADIGVDTFLGITKQPFDITKIPSTTIEHTNKFKLPRSEANERIFEFAGIAGSQSNVPYASLSCNIIDSIFIGRGYAILDNIDEKYYYITYYENKKAFIDLAKNYTLQDAIDDYIDDGAYTASLGSSFATAISALKAGSDAFIYPNNTQYRNTSDEVTVATEISPGDFRRSSDLWICVNDIIDFYCTSIGYTFTDSVGIDLYLPLNHVTLLWNWNGGISYFNVGYESQYTSCESFGNYSMLEVIKVFAQKFNSFIDIDENSKTVKIVPFISLYSTADTSLDDKLVSYEKSFVPSNYSQENIIGFEPDKDVDKSQFDMIFNVTNANLNASKEYLTINSLAPKYLYYVDFDINDYEISPTVEKLPLMIVDKSDQGDTLDVKYHIDNPNLTTTYTNSMTLPKLKWYDATAYYKDMEAPVFDKYEMFTAELIMNLIDYLNISPYKKFFFSRLGGNFIINKISGFNPSNNGTTKLELIRIR